jgi:flagellar basal-body rod protein FlgG
VPALTANRQVALAGTYEVPGPGPQRPTGRGLDVALGADELLVVLTDAGRTYTRNGALAVTPTGELTDAGGHPVLGAGAVPVTGLSTSAVVTASGDVVDGERLLGRLLVVRDPGGLLEPLGDGLLTAGGRDASLETVAVPTVLPGHLEGSTTNPVEELVRLLEAQRAFESYQRLITMTMYDVNRRTVGEIAG